MEIRVTQFYKDSSLLRFTYRFSATHIKIPVIFVGGNGFLFFFFFFFCKDLKVNSKMLMEMQPETIKKKKKKTEAQEGLL